MLELTLTAVVLVAICVAIHAYGTTYWLRFLVHRYAGQDGNFMPRMALHTVTWTAVVLMLLHVVEVLVWALAYLLFLPGDHFDSFEKAAYFSFVTFTTVGYGDITLVEHEWRLLSGIEALVGIMLVGWTTAFLFAVVQRSARAMERGRAGD